MDKIVARYNGVVRYMQYSDFDQLEEIGSGGYGSVYTARYKGGEENVPEIVVLKRFKRVDYHETLELFISEVSNNCSIN